MSLQLSVSARNSRLDSLEVSVGASPKLQIFTGPAPANCAAADSGTKLAEFPLDADWMAAASSGSKQTTKGGSAISSSNAYTTTGFAAGTAAHFRLKDSAGTTCHLQGTVTATGGGGDMTLDNTSIASGQSVQVNTFTLSDANA